MTHYNTSYVDRPSVAFLQGYRHNLFMLLEKVKATITRYGMLKKGTRLLVAVSGGVDSVVLLEVLRLLAPEFSLELVIAHLNHELRGEEAEADARFVASLGEVKGIRLISKRLDVRSLSEKKGLSLEEAGRLVRRDFLEETAQQVGANQIALGHTRNDRAETLLFNLIRGAGPTGLIGVRPMSSPYIRPLIDTSRREILAFARFHSLPWREDATNQDITFSRNRIRHQVIPLLEQMNPRLLEALYRTADLLLEERRALDFLLDSPWKEVLLSAKEGEIVLYRDRLARFPSELQGLLLRRGVARARGDLQGIERAHIDALCRLVASPRTHGEANLPKLIAQVQEDELLLSTHQKTIVLPYEFPVKLGRTVLSSLGIAIELSIEDWNGVPESLSKWESTVEVADADRTRFPLCLRNRQTGDCFRPLGMKGEKKLKDFLIDEHVPFYRRATLPLLCDKERIIWVVGVRLSDAVCVTAQTTRVLVMRMEETT